MDIDVDATLSWARPHRLTLDAWRGISISMPVTSQGTGGVTLITDDGGSGGDYVFAGEGKVASGDSASRRIANGQSCTLVSDIASLAAGVAADPAGAFALAKGYDASA